jgi:type II secretory pathway pseudopilin PulG
MSGNSFSATHWILQHKGERGAILLGMLIGLMLLGIGLASYSQSWAVARQRAMEDELLFIGQQYQQALRSYYQASGPARTLPAKLDDLVDDRRFPNPVHHLRKPYRDPLAPQTEWGLIMQGGVILGIYSQAPGTPYKQAHFDPPFENFAGAKTYADWRFVFFPRGLGPTPGGPAQPGPAPGHTNNR